MTSRLGGIAGTRRRHRIIDSRAIGTIMAKYVMCLDNQSYPLDLTLHKVYRVLPDEKGEQHGMIRVVDNTGEDYLYPPRLFASGELSEVAQRSFDAQPA